MCLGHCRWQAYSGKVKYFWCRCTFSFICYSLTHRRTLFVYTKYYKKHQLRHSIEEVNRHSNRQRKRISQFDAHYRKQNISINRSVCLSKFLIIICSEFACTQQSFTVWFWIALVFFFKVIKTIRKPKHLSANMQMFGFKCAFLLSIFFVSCKFQMIFLCPRDFCHIWINFQMNF